MNPFCSIVLLFSFELTFKLSIIKNTGIFDSLSQHLKLFFIEDIYSHHFKYNSQETRILIMLLVIFIHEGKAVYFRGLINFLKAVLFYNKSFPLSFS